MRNKYCRTTYQNPAMWKVGGDGSLVWKKYVTGKRFS